MAVNNTQYLSFLGGLVSPRLWLRSDMDKFGKWFATADNIRFHTVGSFENRFGTIKIGNTYRNTAGENIKLIKFDFGQGETCMLELGSGYFRVIAGGKYILDENNVPLVFNTQIVLSDTDDIKYVQSGDIIFLTNSKGIYEIKRKSKDFTEWEVVPFEFTDGIVPYGDENDEDANTLTASETTLTPFWSFNIPTGDDGIFRVTNVQITFSGSSPDVTYNSTPNVWLDMEDLVDDVSSVASSCGLDVSYSGTLIKFTDASSTDVLSITLYCEYMQFQNINNTFNGVTLSTLQELYSVTPNKYRYNNGNDVSVSSKGKFTNGFDVTPVTFYARVHDNLDNAITSINTDISSYSDPNYGTVGNLNVSATKTAANQMKIGTYCGGTLSDNLYKNTKTGSYDGDKADGKINSSFIGGFEGFYYFTDTNGVDWLRNKASYTILTPVSFSHTTTQQIAIGYYSVESDNFNFFSDKENGESFLLRNEIPASYIHATKTGYTTSDDSTETQNPPIIKSNGFWRYNSSGLWSGEVKLEYSVDNGNSWITFFNRKNSSYSNYSTTNDNTSGTIKTDKITILIRMIASNIAEDNASKFSAELATDKFEVNSVYKIYNKTSDSTAVVECVKGDIGEFTNNSHWREAEFSYANGYPTAIGFYQNRLFLGKEYKLYSSRINDFWDFYEPIEVADDDPMTMSLLSYKVNNIQNLIGIRSFFVFTSGGEFGIGAEGGALTQATKYLKQISAHGSNSCNPIFCGDIIVFVDKTNNTVRAFRYSLEADGWEATDVSVLIEQVLGGKKIVTTEYMQDTKECLFLTDEGEVYVFKFFQEQNIAAWSVWKHAKYKITNLCVLEDNLGKDILYIAVNADTGMQIEQFNPNYYCDSVEIFSNETAFDSVTTTFQENDQVVVNDGTDLYLAEVGENGVVSLRNDSTYAAVGLSYTSTATLLSPEIQDRDGTFSTFNRKRPFKVYCFYRDSYGFKVGVEEENKQEIQFQPVWSDVDSETDLTTGKASVLIPARYDGSSRVSFVQEKPYPMIIENILLETDYGGK